MHRWRNPVVGVVVFVFWVAFEGAYALLTPCELAFSDVSGTLFVFEECSMQLQFLGIGLGLAMSLGLVGAARALQAIVGG